MGGAARRPLTPCARLLTLTNPPTIIMFAAVFAALAPPSGFAPGTALLTIAGVFGGSLLWWLGLTLAVTALRGALGPRVRAWIDRVSGAALALFGVAEVRRAMQSKGAVPACATATQQRSPTVAG